MEPMAYVAIGTIAFLALILVIIAITGVKQKNRKAERLDSKYQE